MTEFDASTCANCIRILLGAMTDPQRKHAATFLLADVERLHLAAGNKPPAWIGVLRAKNDWQQSPPPPTESVFAEDGA